MAFLKQLIQKVALLFLSKEKKEVIKTLQDYADAFMTFKPENVLGYLDRPLTFLSDDGPHIYSNDEEITVFLQGYMDELQSKEYARDDLSHFHLKTLTPTVAVTSFSLVRYNKDNQPFNNMGAMYTWRKTGGSWRCIIGVLLSH